MADEYVVVLSTFPADGDAEALAATLVEERLAACVNVLPRMTSVYLWAERVEEESEQQLVMKTTLGRVPALWERLRELHPYEVPEFVVLPIMDGNAAYLKWIGDAVRPEPA